MTEIDNTHYLQALFAPQRIVLVGATERPEKLGRYVLENLLAGGFQGDLYVVNPKYHTVLGHRCYASLADIDVQIDLAIIVTPADTIAAILETGGKKGLRTAVILSAGFAEIGAEGKARTEAILRTAKQYGIRLLGPNCLGLIRTDIGLNATFARTPTQRGRLALISQSGAICSAILDWAVDAGVSFSSIVSLGVAADLDFDEVLDYFLHDPATDAILLYIEGIRNAQRFMSSLRACVLKKPVIALKVGRHQAGTRAVSSHTGALVGNDAVFDAALRCTGTIRVKTTAQLFDAARILSSGRFIAGSLSHAGYKGNRLAIITNGGGPGVMAADCAEDNGIALASLSPSTLKDLNAKLSATWSHGNPVDIIGDAPPAHFEQAVSAALMDSNVDAVLVLYTPQIVTGPLTAAQAVVRAAQHSNKPILAAWYCTSEASEVRRLFNQHKIPNFATPEEAVEAFSLLSTYERNQRRLLQAPASLPISPAFDSSAAQKIYAAALAEGRALLTQGEAFTLLAAFGIKVPDSRVAGSIDEALAAADSMGYPVVLKIHSRTITHKSDVGGVRLNLTDSHSLIAAYHDMLAQVAQLKPEAKIEGVLVQRMLSYRHAREVLIGITTDKVFGPVITFGSGGVAVEQLQDTAIALPPLNRMLALDLINSTHITRLLEAYRHIPAADREALATILLQVSTMACELPWLVEMDLNPVLAHERGATVADARILINLQP